MDLALIEAATLAQALTTHALPAALSHYSRTRRKHLCFYQFATRWTTPFFQSEHLPLGWLRDLVFPIIQRIPLLRRQMISTMAGGKTGPFSSLQGSR